MKKRTHQFVSNLFNESITLLAIKYEVDEKRLKQIVKDYGTMTRPISQLALYESNIEKTKTVKPKTWDREIVDVNTALTRLSETYAMDKKFLSALIIEWKILEGSKNSSHD